MGQGIRTALAAAVSRKLGVPAERVDACDRRHACRAAAPHGRVMGYGLARFRPRDAAADAMLKALRRSGPTAVAGRTPAQILQSRRARPLWRSRSDQGARPTRRDLRPAESGPCSAWRPGLSGFRHVQLHRAFRRGADRARRRDASACRGSSASLIAAGWSARARPQPGQGRRRVGHRRGACAKPAKWIRATAASSMPISPNMWCR